MWNIQCGFTSSVSDLLSPSSAFPLVLRRHWRIFLLHWSDVPFKIIPNLLVGAKSRFPGAFLWGLELRFSNLATICLVVLLFTVSSTHQLSAIFSVVLRITRAHQSGLPLWFHFYRGVKVPGRTWKSPFIFDHISLASASFSLSQTNADSRIISLRSPAFRVASRASRKFPIFSLTQEPDRPCSAMSETQTHSDTVTHCGD